MKLSGGPVLQRPLSAFTTGVLDKGPPGPGLEPQKWEKCCFRSRRGGPSASSVSDWRPSDALALLPQFAAAPLRLRPRDCSFLAVVTAGKSCASRLGLANAGRDSTGSIALNVRAQLRTVPAGEAWPNLHSTLRPCDVSRTFLYKAGERRNSCTFFRPSCCALFSRALCALPSRP